MKTMLLVLLQMLVSAVAWSQENINNKPIFPEDHAEKLEWWKDARFGMFIHWGPVSLNGTEIGWSRGREISIEKYDSLYLQFNPVNFDADDWVSVARSAGMKYLVFTAKHHDGFCLWNTEYSGYNIMHSPFNRDVVKELSEACKKQGIAFGVYYSTCDWHHSDFPRAGQGGRVQREKSDIDQYTKYLKNQSEELIQNYGPLLVLWYDVPQEFDSVRGQGVINHVRAVQPGILVNNRTGAQGDFDTPEQRLGDFNIYRPWETCMTIGQQWAWKPNEKVKSFEQCLHNLIRTVGGDGNLLFNIGPRPDGLIEPEQVQMLKEMGEWLDRYGQSVYGTRGGPFKPTDWGVSTRKGNKVYLHLLNVPEGLSELTLPDIGIELISCTLLGGKTLEVENKSNEMVIDLGKISLNPVNTVIELQFKESVMAIEPLDAKPISITYKKQVKASSNMVAQWSERVPHLYINVNSVVNGDWSGDFWHPAEGDQMPWLEIDLGTEKLVKDAVFHEWGENIKKYELQYEVDGQWRTLHQGKDTSDKHTISFPVTRMDKFRLIIKEYTGIPGIYELMLY